jgi:flagellar biosynthesis protein FlhG
VSPVRPMAGRVLGRGLKDLTSSSLRSLESLELFTTSREKRANESSATQSHKTFPRVVVVSSGKGGTGKSFLSVNVACGLAQQGQRVLVVDTDFGLANAHLLLGLNPRYDISHLITGRVPVQEIIQKSAYDVSLLSGCSGIAELSNLTYDQFNAFISGVLKVEHDYDWIVVDTSAGISTQVMSFLTAASQILLVVNPEATSMLDAYAMMKTLFGRHPGVEVGFVSNRVKDSIVAKETFKKLNGAAEHYLKKSLVDTGFVVMDSAVSQSVLNRRPLILDEPRSHAAFCLKKIVHKVLKHESKDKQKESYFSRLRKEVMYWQNGRYKGNLNEGR